MLASSGGWSGRAADAFGAHWGSMAPELDDGAEGMRQVAAFAVRFAGFAAQGAVATAAVKQVALDQDPFDVDNWSGADALGVGAGGFTSAGLFVRGVRLAGTPARASASGFAADAATSAGVDLVGGDATAGQVVANALLSAGTGRIPLDRTHILRGGINAKGKATGFHHRGTPVDEAHARVVPGTQSAPDARGVYRAKVEIYDDARGMWVAKAPKSTFFPDSWSTDRVVYEIQAASRNRLPTPPGKPANYWQGVSPSGMRIGGFRDTTGGIKTAFPFSEIEVTRFPIWKYDVRSHMASLGRRSRRRASRSPASSSWTSNRTRRRSKSYSRSSGRWTPARWRRGRARATPSR